MNDLLFCIIEDNVSNRKLFVTLFKRAGYNVIDFGEGRSAIDWLESNSPDCVLIDILLPDMNGSDIAKFIKTKEGSSQVTLIAVTGFGQLMDREKFLTIGFDGYIPKPVNISTFVDEVLDIHETRQVKP